MLFAILFGFIAAACAPLLRRLLGRYVFVPMAGLPLLLFLYFCYLAPEVVAGATVTAQYAWVPELGVSLQFRLDGLSLLFALLITFFGTLIMLYASAYLEDDPLLGRFYLYLTLFMTAMLGLVLSDNILCLFLFWELTSVSSYLLIGYKQEKNEARVAAWQALLVTGAGGLALLAGLLLLRIAGGGAATFSELAALQGQVQQHALYLPALLLILLACFTKSAQFPFHFWLPNAMAAPTPVSAYLHSATMVKAGIYLLARLSPVLSGSEAWHVTLMSMGGITAVMGALLALQHTDLKAILAYTTISALGLLVTMLGIGTALATKAMLVFLVAHALYKGTLFLVAGAVDHSTGTREVPRLQQLAPSMKFSAWAATLAALSMAGIIPFVGFVGKELLYEASLPNLVLLGVSMVTGLVFVAVALQLSYGIFWQKAASPTPLLHEATPGLFLPPLALGLTGLLAGVFAGPVLSPLLVSGARQILQARQVELHLALWHGLTPVLGLSLLTVLLGFLLYRYLPAARRSATSTAWLYRYGPNALYHRAFDGFLRFSKSFTGWLQNGYLRSYIVNIVFFFCSLLLFVLWRDSPPVNLVERAHLLQQIRLYELVLLVLMVAALVFLLGTRSRLTSIVVMGLVGYSAALFYIFFGAPDVAATQLLIETLTVVIFVLLLHRLPAFIYLSHQFNKYKFIAISVFFGSLMTYVMLLVQQHTVESELKQYFGKASYLEAHGRNIVNVILVDFRGLDTLGEISVLAVAALGIFALLRLNPEKGGKR